MFPGSNSFLVRIVDASEVSIPIRQLDRDRATGNYTGKETPGKVIAVTVADNRKAILAQWTDGSISNLLTLAEIPKTSNSGFGITAQAFESISLSPDHNTVAFSTQGNVHGWLD